MKADIEDSINITDEVATYSSKQLADLLIFLDKNDFKKMFFDGYNSSVEVIRIRKIE